MAAQKREKKKSISRMSNFDLFRGRKFFPQKFLPLSKVYYTLHLNPIVKNPITK